MLACRHHVAWPMARRWNERRCGMVRVSVTVAGMCFLDSMTRGNVDAHLDGGEQQQALVHAYHLGCNADSHAASLHTGQPKRKPCRHSNGTWTGSSCGHVAQYVALFYYQSVCRQVTACRIPACAAKCSGVKPLRLRVSMYTPGDKAPGHRGQGAIAACKFSTQRKQARARWYLAPATLGGHV